MPEPAPRKPVERVFWGLVALAAVGARGFHLGSFSMWLDEVLLMLRATRGGPAAVWEACRANAEHPPLSALAMAAAHGLGFSETGQRWIPALLGVATVMLLAVWTGRHFGRAAGLATGWITALLPFSVRYSQELRPYAWLLFFAVLTLLAADRLLRHPGLSSALGVFGAAVGGLYSHVLFPLLAVPLGVLLGEAAWARDSKRRRRGRRALGLGLAAAGAAVLVYLPWILPALGELSGRPPGGRVEPWTWERVAERWQFLTVGGVEGDGATWAAGLALALAAVGAAAAWRKTAGRAALAGALAGTLGVEVVLLRLGHWSNGRYDMLGWLFLPVLMGVGFGVLWRWRRRWGRGVAVAVLAALTVGEAAGLARYARVGRPHWDQVAAAVRQVRRPGEPVLVENEWTRICVGYYLQGPDFQHRRREESAAAIVRGVEALRRLWPPDRAAVLVVGGMPWRRSLRRWSWTFPQVLRVPESSTRVVLLTPEVRRELAADEGRAGPAAPGAAAGDRAMPPPPPPPPGWLLGLERLGGVR